MTDTPTPEPVNASWFAALKGRTAKVITLSGPVLPEQWYAESPHVKNLLGLGKTPAEAIADFNAKMVKP